MVFYPGFETIDLFDLAWRLTINTLLIFLKSNCTKVNWTLNSHLWKLKTSNLLLKWRCGTLVGDVSISHGGYRRSKDWRTDENVKTIDKNIVSGKDTFQKLSQNVTKLKKITIYFFQVLEKNSFKIIVIAKLYLVSFVNFYNCNKKNLFNRILLKFHIKFFIITKHPIKLKSS